MFLTLKTKHQFKANQNLSFWVLANVLAATLLRLREELRPTGGPPYYSL